MVVRWTFLDPNTSTTTEFEVNPQEGGSLPLEKNITSHSTVAYDGATILMEGNEPPQEMTFSGNVYTHAAYLNMVTMFSKRHQIQITDDLGRTFMVYFTNFEPKRVRSRNYSWKHSYVVTALIVDWP